MGRIDEQDFDEKRLARRQRRKRSQLIAYIILTVFVLAVLGGGAFGVHYLGSFAGKSKQSGDSAKESTTESTQEQVAVIETPEETVPEPEEMSQDDVLMEIVNSCIGDMTLEDKVASLFVITPEQLTGVETVVKAGSGTQESLSQYAVGGLVYSAKNIKSESQIAEMMKSTGDMSKYPLFTVIHEFSDDFSAITNSVGQLDMPEITDEETAYNAGATIAGAMFKYGFNMNLAPDMDITDTGVLGSDAEKAGIMAAAFSRGMSESGMSACAYDFPVSADTLAGMATDEITKEELIAGSYSVYKKAIEEGSLKAIMLSNVSLPQVVGDNTPVSLSNIMIQNEIRSELGFDGVVLTGALNEGAITEYYTSDQAAIAAIRAGADMIYLPEDFKAAYDGLLAAVQAGDITEERINESLTRIFRIKYANRVE